MLPFLWLAVSPNAGVPIDNDTVAELHLCFRTLVHHGEAMDMSVIARPADFPVLEFAVPPTSALICRRDAHMNTASMEACKKKKRSLLWDVGVVS
ncbi:hypothetical protein [Nereida ignava]|uniref:hypothetical protein n=1 Tax=Nereida ignava TaxID=282199 RepID=UPI0030F9E7D0